MNAVEVVDKQGLDKDNFLVMKEVRFPHGRADAVIYCLIKGLYVVPLGIEVKKEVKSGTEFLEYVNQMRETYEHAFTHIYLAVGEIRSKVKEFVKGFLKDVGYGLIKVDEDSINVVVEAMPKKIYRSWRDYNEVASRGTLYISTRQALMDEGFDEENMRFSEVWMGLKSKINYEAFLYHNYAAFGVCAIPLDKVKKLLSFLNDREELLQSLRKSRYRIFLESYLRRGRVVIGYIRHLDEPVSVNTVKMINDRIKQGVKPMPFPGWGSRIGVYKRLWNVENVPTYSTALRDIKDALNQLKIFREKELIPYP